MNRFYISLGELRSAQDFFKNNDINVLTAQSFKINRKQPNFTGIVLALELFGLDRPTVEDLLESIFVVYFAQTELKKKSIATITIGQIKKNIEWFGQFISYYNGEKNDGQDLLELNFLRDVIVLEYALETLQMLFGDFSKVPKEVVFSYFAVLKAIEMGAEKG